MAAEIKLIIARRIVNIIFVYNSDNRSLFRYIVSQLIHIVSKILSLLEVWVPLDEFSLGNVSTNRNAFLHNMLVLFSKLYFNIVGISCV